MCVPMNSFADDEKHSTKNTTTLHNGSDVFTFLKENNMLIANPKKENAKIVPIIHHNLTASSEIGCQSSSASMTSHNFFWIDL